MKELMPDNISLLQALEAMHPAAHMTSHTKPRMREVSDILTWVYCFLAYTAIRTPDKQTRDLLVYARILMREARKHGGDGWKAYDAVFRENAAASNEVDWTKLEGSLHATTLVANRTSDGMFCHFCSEADHFSEECALSSVKQTTSNKPSQKAGSMLMQEESRGTKWQKGKSALRPIPYAYKGTPGNICHSWNYGRCIFPNRCRLQHIRVFCFKRSGSQKEHPARECPESSLQGDRQPSWQQGIQAKGQQ